MIAPATGEYQQLQWQLVHDSLGYGEIYETAEDGGPGDLVASVFSDHEHLIAAAPDLLAALVVMVYETTHLSPCRADGSHDCRISGDALAKARAAIALATQEPAR